MIPFLLNIPLCLPFYEICAVIFVVSMLLAFLLGWLSLMAGRLYPTTLVMRVLGLIGVVVFLLLSMQSDGVQQYLVQAALIAPLLTLFILRPLRKLPQNYAAQLRIWHGHFFARVRWFWWPLLRFPLLYMVFVDVCLSLLG